MLSRSYQHWSSSYLELRPLHLEWPFFFLNSGAVPFLFPPHPHPSPSGRARVSLTQFHCLNTVEGQQNINDFLTRISSSKQDLLKEVLVIKENKEIFDTLHTAAYGAEGNFFRPMVVLTDFEE